ncbi:MAG: DUF418 domain-containing protein [Gemmatimonadota bacterium]
MSESIAGALPTRERIQALDVLRGLAVAGILLANVLVFFGIIFLSADQRAAFPTAAADAVVAFLEHTFVDGKFYSVFSLLFGIGFGVQLSRGGDAALPRFRRRLRILLGIGAIHAFLIWSGDILMLYALLGFTLPWFARRSQRTLLRWTVGLLTTPTVLYLVALGIWLALGLPVPSGPPAGPAAGLPADLLAKIAAMGTGGVKEAFVGNLINVLLRWGDLFVTVRFPKVLGMFVLGLWSVRAGIALAPANYRALLLRWCGIGWAVGLSANLVATWADARWGNLPPSPGGLISVVASAVGVPLLAIGYATSVALLVTAGVRFITIFAPLGRMALTNYLMHSVICVVLSRGFGYGLWWRIGTARAMEIAAAIIVVQLPLSAWWLSRYRFGPVEWIWRRLTYGRPI